MSWYNPADWGKAIFDKVAEYAPSGLDFITPIHNANKKQEAGYYGMATQARNLGEAQKAFQMQGLDKAEGYFSPARARLDAMYGAPGGAPPGNAAARLSALNPHVTGT